MNTTRFLWRQPLGRIAVLAIAVGLIGLIFHYWCGALMLAALPNYSGSAADGATRNAAGVDDEHVPGGWAVGASNPRGVPTAP